VNALVVGSGAVGSLLAWVLAIAGWRVTIVRRGLAGEADAARPLVVVRSDGRLYYQ
jgi:glycine/D-amino acid oxidase-like deaminating enzyme